MHRRWRFVVAGLALLLATSVMAPTPVRAQETTLNLNTATREQLLAFPGIGQAYADKIIAARPFKMRSELVGRHIMPAAAYLKIKKRLLPTAEDAAVEKAMESAPTGPPASTSTPRVDSTSTWPRGTSCSGFRGSGPPMPTRSSRAGRSSSSTSSSGAGSCRRRPTTRSSPRSS